MGRKWLTVTAAGLLWVAALPPATEAQELTAEGNKVVQELLADWETRFRATDIATAMNNLEIAPNDELRLAVGERFREDPAMARPLRQWGAKNFILSNDEKRLAKYLISVYEQSKAMPSLAAIAEAVELPADEVKARLEFMAKAGLLERSESQAPGYALVEDYATWGGPLRYNFHSVAVEGTKPFGVW